MRAFIASSWFLWMLFAFLDLFLLKWIPSLEESIAGFPFDRFLPLHERTTLQEVQLAA